MKIRYNEELKNESVSVYSEVYIYGYKNICDYIKKDYTYTIYGANVGTSYLSVVLKKLLNTWRQNIIDEAIMWSGYWKVITNVYMYCEGKMKYFNKTQQLLG